MIGKMMELWRKWFGKETLPVVENDKVTAPEETEIQENNRLFYRQSPEQDSWTLVTGVYAIGAFIVKR